MCFFPFRLQTRQGHLDEGQSLCFVLLSDGGNKPLDAPWTRHGAKALPRVLIEAARWQQTLFLSVRLLLPSDVRKAFFGAHQCIYTHGIRSFLRRILGDNCKYACR